MMFLLADVFRLFKRILSGFSFFIFFAKIHINPKPGNPMPLGVGRKGFFFYKKNKKNLLFFYSLLKNPAY